MKTSHSALKALQATIRELEQHLDQVEDQGKYTTLEADFLLDQIRQLYAKGLAFRQSVSPVQQEETWAKGDQPSKRKSMENFPGSHDHDPEPVAEPESKPVDQSKPSKTNEEAEQSWPSAASPQPTNQESSMGSIKQDDEGEPESVAGSSAIENTKPTTTPATSTGSENTEDKDASTNTAESNESQTLPEGQVEPQVNSVNKDNNSAAETDKLQPEDSYKQENEKVEDHQPNFEPQHRGNAIHDKFRGKQVSLHEHLMAQNGGQSLADRFKNMPIQDLRAAIGLNERAKFVRELFNGDRQAYFDTIDALNQKHNYQEALDYLEYEVKPAHQWENHQEAVEGFLELVYRRFLNTATKT